MNTKEIRGWDPCTAQHIYIKSLHKNFSNNGQNSEKESKNGRI